MKHPVIRLSLVCGGLLLAACAVPGLSTNPTASGGSGLALQAIKQIAVGKTPHGMAAAGGYIYDSNIGDGTISVIDANSDVVTQTIAVPNGGIPGTSAAFPDAKDVIVCDTKNNALLVIDPAQGHKIIQTIALPQTPSNLSIDDDNQSVFVTTTGNQAYLLTFGTDRAQPPQQKSFPVGASSAEDRSAAFSGDWGAVPSNGDNNVQLINMTTGQVTSVSDGNNPQPTAIGKMEDQGVVAIVGNFASSTITFYELPNGAKTTLTGVGLSPDDIAVDSDLHRAYLTMAGSNQVAVVDYLAKTLVGLVNVGQRPVHIAEAPVMPQASPSPSPSAGHWHVLHNGAVSAPLSHEFWVGDDASGGVTVFDGASLMVKATIATDSGHHKLAFWGTRAFVSNLDANDVSVVDRTQIP